MTDSTASPVATLPDKLSALIRVAVADMRKVQADPRYRLTPSVWHQPQGARCAVCMGGAVLAGTLQIPRERSMWPDHDDGVFEGLSEDVTRKIEALDSVRIGELVEALDHLGIDFSAVPDDQVNDLFANAQQYGGFYPLESYEQAADILEKAGL